MRTKAWSGIGAVLAVVIAAAAVFWAKEWMDRGKADAVLIADPVHLNVMVVNYSEKSFDKLTADFKREYGEGLREAFPHLTLEFKESRVQDLTADDYADQIMTELEEQQADLLFVPIDPTGELFDRLTAQGKLHDLSLFPGDRSSWHLPPGTLKKLDDGTGEWHYLAMSMITAALVYNPELFDLHHVPYPRDDMTWSDVFELAKQFPPGVAGLELPLPDAWTVAERIAYTERLAYADPVQNRVLVDSPEWKNVIRMAADGLIGGYVRPDMSFSLFTSGQAAMALVSYPMLQSSMKQSGSAVEWRSVTEPVSAEARGQTSAYTLTDMWAIMQNSREPDAAWELLRYLFRDNSAAKWKSIFADIMLTNTKVMAQFESADKIEAFYKLLPREDAVPDISRERAAGLGLLFREEMNRIVSGEVTADEGIRSMVNAGNELLLSGGG